MSQLTHACNAILQQLSDAIQQLSETEFTCASETLSGSSIGQHLRHTLEFFVCLEQGFSEGVINYDKRAHDKLIETDKETALLAIARIREFINFQTQDKPLLLELEYNPRNNETLSIQTNYWRELTYNIEHAVHHMAIMKIGIREVARHISLPDGFGVAASTLRYRSEVMVDARA